jgi:hypothetical protein
MIEDRWTADFVAGELIPALERAGATVLTARERDPSARATLADTTSPGFAAVGVLWRERPAPDGRPARRVADAPAVRLAADGLAAWRLAAPESGTRQVYARWIAAADADPAATYVVATASGAVATTVDQRGHGGEWFPIASVDVAEGEPIEVSLHGSGAGPLSADAIRVGGGSARVWTPRRRAWTHRALFDLAAVHRLEHRGAPAALWEPPGSGAAGDATSRARWTAWSHPDHEEAVFLSVHTNAGGGTGTQVFVRETCRTVQPCPERVARSVELADAVGAATVAVMRRRTPDWTDRGTTRNDLAEINDTINPELPAALLEVGFHDRPADAAVLLDPTVPAELADALVDALVAWRDPDAPTPPPPPAVRWADATVTWEPAADGARGWRVRTRTATGWAPPAWTTARDLTVADDVIAVEVAAIGDGGMSRPARAERVALVAEAAE